MKKILNGLFSKSNETTNLFFYRDDKGQEYFCPWGKPGETWHLDSGQKKYIEIATSCILLIAAALSIYSKMIWNVHIFAVVIMIVNLSILGNIIFIYAYTRKLKSFIDKENTKDFSFLDSKVIKKSFQIFAIQISLVFLGLLFFPYDYFLWGSGIYIVLFYPTSMLLLKHKKNHIFQKLS